MVNISYVLNPKTALGYQTLIAYSTRVGDIASSCYCCALVHVCKTYHASGYAWAVVKSTVEMLALRMKSVPYFEL